MPYATSADLTAWTGTDAPDNVAVLLREASALVAEVTRLAVYDTDDAGLPTNDPVSVALRDATCAQAALWAATGIDPLTGAVGAASNAASGVVSSSSIGGASVSYAVAADAADLRVAAVDSLTPSALRILRAAGLLSTAVASY